MFEMPTKLLWVAFELEAAAAAAPLEPLDGVAFKLVGVVAPCPGEDI